MKKIVILVLGIIIMLIVYIVFSGKLNVSGENNQASVISNIFSKSKTTDTKQGVVEVTTAGSATRSFPVKPVMTRFSGHKESDIQSVYIDGLKRAVPRGEVPR